MEQAKKPATGENVSHIHMRFSTFCDSFKVVQKAFCGESIKFLEINF